MKNGQKTKEYISYFYNNNKMVFALAILISLISILCDIGTAYVLQNVMDAATSGNIKNVLEIIFPIVIFVVTMLVIWIVSRTLKYLFVKRAITNYRTGIFNEIADRSISDFYGENTGRYISVLTNDVSVIEQNYVKSIFDIIESICLFLGTLVAMFLYSWQMLIVVVVSSIFPLIVTIVFSNIISKKEKEVSDYNETYVSTLRDLLLGFTVIKSFKAEKEVKKRIGEKGNRLEILKYKRNVAEEYIGISAEFFGCIAQIAVFIFGAYLAVKGTITAGVVIAYVQLMNYILRPLEALPELIAKRKAAKGLIDKVAVYVEVGEENLKQYEIDTDDVNISLKDVTVIYDDEREIIKDISLAFNKGKSYAIVGSSGSGKTTLLNTIVGNIHGYKGSIQIGNRELKTISSDSLYDKISIIEQKVFIFDSSVVDNITMFKECEESKLDEVIDKAGLRMLITEKGKDYLCGENGVNLSGGERQRIAIARALLKHPSLIMVDEGTSALDAKTSFEVTNEILSLEDITKIVVTHKLDEVSLKKYDEIIVMSHGKVVEMGTYEKLLEKKQILYSLVNIEK